LRWAERNGSVILYKPGLRWVSVVVVEPLCDGFRKLNPSYADSTHPTQATQFHVVNQVETQHYLTNQKPQKPHFSVQIF